MQHLKTLGAGVLVYLVMAACSAAGTSRQNLKGAGGSAGQAATGGAGGVPGGTGGMVADSGLDALADAVGDALSDAAADAVNPVPDADAAPASQVVNAPCDIRDGSLYFAEAAFPGKQATELASVVAVLNWSKVLPPKDLGYTRQLRPYTLVADGKVAVMCGQDADRPDSVDFVLP